MSAEVDIQSALNAHLATMVDVPPVAWPNTTFDPTGESIWLEVNHLPRETDAPRIGDSSALDLGGIYQITVVTRLGENSSEALQMSEILIDRFARGFIGNDVRVRKAWRAGGFADGSYWRTPVSVAYRVII